jgi:uncharacterized protein (DUF1697 family)
MQDLKTLYESLDFHAVRTYIQSGNVIFATETAFSHHDLAHRIEQAIAKQYAFEIPVIVRTAAEMQTVLQTNPFVHRNDVIPEKLHVTFLAATPDAVLREAVSAINYPPDEFIISGAEVFLHCPQNYGETKLSNKFFENKLKVSATTRNWKTVNTLVELATLVSHP